MDNMIEYVERDAVLTKAAPVPGCFCNMISSWDVVHLPAADVAPVVHGKWELIHRQADGGFVKCSVCGRTYTFNSFFRADDCPYCHCGAKMDMKD